MQQHAKVIRLPADGTAELIIRRSSACGSCEDCLTRESCALQEQSLTVTARNPVGAQPGDTVLIQTSSKGVLLAAVVVYLLPLLGFLAGTILGLLLALPALLTGLAGLVLCAVCAVCYNRRVKRRGSLESVITAVVKE